MWERIARSTSRHTAVVVVAWIVLAILGNVFIPQLETVVKTHSRSFLPVDAPSVVGAEKMGKYFHDSGSNNLGYIVFESSNKLSEADRSYYNSLLKKALGDKTHVNSALDMWSNPLAAPFSQSNDGRSVYVLLRLAGDLGTTQAGESVAAVRHMVSAMPPPARLHVYVTGPGATVADELTSIDSQMLVIIIGTVIVIAVLMFLVYRSAITSRIPLVPVALALGVARPAVAFLGEKGLVEVSVFSENLLASMTLGAVTNYGIFMVGRYQELRRSGVPPEEALIKAYRSVAPVIVASALTIVFALSSLAFAKIGLLRTAGIPCGVSLVVGMFAALTLLPALIGAASRRGLAEPRPLSSKRRWRRFGSIVARWPAPVMVAGVTALLILALPLAAMRITFAEYKAQPTTTESNRGYEAADRHFPPNRLLPEIISISADHDLRNPAGLIAIEHVASKILQIPGVRAVQSATRPASAPLSEASLTSQAGQVGGQLNSSMDATTAKLGDIQRLTDSLSSAEGDIDKLQASLTSGVDRIRTISDGTGALTGGMERLHGTLNTVSQYIDPIRNYVNGVPNCPTDVLCSQLTKVIGPLDDVLSTAGQLSQGASTISGGSNAMAGSFAAMPNALDGLKSMLSQMRGGIDSLMSSMKSTQDQMHDFTSYLHEMDKDFRNSGLGGFYLPERALSDPRFAEVFKLFFSPDGRVTRLLVYSEGEAFGSDGARIAREVRSTVHEATKEGTLANNEVLATGVGSAVEDLQNYIRHDLILLASVALLFIFFVVIMMLRSLIAGIAVLATVVLSFASALGLSVVFWQLIIGRELHWAVPAIAFIALVAVGSDYNLLFTARLKEEIPVGMKTGMIRTFHGTGSVVTAAGIVFGVTMFALLRSSIMSVAQVGTTVGLGLIIDTLIVRTMVMPAIAGILGKWFWWPLPVTSRARRRLVSSDSGQPMADVHT